MKFTTYSLIDTTTILYHPSVGRATLSAVGLGKVTISRSGDLSSHTATADGTVVVNRLRSYNGTVTLEIPQNSEADRFLRRWLNYLQSHATGSSFAASTLTIRDTAANHTYTMTGVTPQKWPDITYDQTATNVTYTLLAAEITEQ